jgi:hypothetical protein
MGGACSTSGKYEKVKDHVGDVGVHEDNINIKGILGPYEDVE